MVPLVYHPRYNITAFGLERRHPFDSRKYRRIHDALTARGLRRPSDFRKPRAVTRSDLLAVHSPEYLRSLKSSETLARILEIPVLGRLPSWFVDWRVLRPMRLATGGTVLACRLAVERGIAINLGGGFHHAAADWGGGFCVYADAPLALKTLYDEGEIERALVVDLDAHQGNGTAATIRDWPWVRIADLYGESLFPGRKESEDYPFPAPDGTTGETYLDVVREFLPLILDEVRPDLVIYNAGSDVLEGDPLARFRLSASEIAERDLLVVTEARARDIPVAMLLSGGYSAESWKLHADAIEGILTRFDRE